MSHEAKEAFLSRWSRRKHEADVPVEPLPPPAASAPSVTLETSADALLELPPIESISVETDLTPYLQATVDQGLKRLALKKLFQDPHFHFANMDKLDIYIDDYSIADPLPAGMLEQLKFAQDYIFKDPTQPEIVSPETDKSASGAEVPLVTEAAPLPTKDHAGADSPLEETMNTAANETEKMSHFGSDENTGRD